MKYGLYLIFLLISCNSNNNTVSSIENKQEVVKEETLVKEVDNKQPSVQNISKSEKKQNKKVKLLNDKIVIPLPDGFELMSEEMLAAKYPSSQRPTLVYTNEDGTINFAFNHTAHQVTQEQLPEFLQAFVQQFSSIYPQIQWVNKEVTKVNNRDFIVMEFITPAVDTRIYNLMYVTSLDGRMLMTTFNCTESQKTEWESKAKECLNSIEVK